MEICLLFLNQRISLKHNYQGLVLMDSQTSGESGTRVLGNLCKETLIIWLIKSRMHQGTLVLYMYGK